MAETLSPIEPSDYDGEASLAVSRAKRQPEVAVEIPVEEQNGRDKEWLPQTEGQLTVDVYQTSTEVVIQSTIAGVKPEDVDITIANEMITIKGKRVREEKVPEENFYYQECYWGPFSRSVILPVEVKGDEAEASLKHGILTIRLPKAEKEKLKKIPVRIV